MAGRDISTQYASPDRSNDWEHQVPASTRDDDKRSASPGVSQARQHARCNWEAIGYEKAYGMLEVFTSNILSAEGDCKSKRRARSVNSFVYPSATTSFSGDLKDGTVDTKESETEERRSACEGAVMRAANGDTSEAKLTEAAQTRYDAVKEELDSCYNCDMVKARDCLKGLFQHHDQGQVGHDGGRPLSETYGCVSCHSPVQLDHSQDATHMIDAGFVPMRGFVKTEVFKQPEQDVQQALFTRATASTSRKQIVAAAINLKSLKPGPLSKLPPVMLKSSSATEEEEIRLMQLLRERRALPVTLLPRSRDAPLAPKNVKRSRQAERLERQAWFALKPAELLFENTLKGQSYQKSFQVINKSGVQRVVNCQVSDFQSNSSRQQFSLVKCRYPGGAARGAGGDNVCVTGDTVTQVSTIGRDTMALGHASGDIGSCKADSTSTGSANTAGACTGDCDIATSLAPGMALTCTVEYHCDGNYPAASSVRVRTHNPEQDLMVELKAQPPQLNIKWLSARAAGQESSGATGAVTGSIHCGQDDSVELDCGYALVGTSISRIFTCRNDGIAGQFSITPHADNTLSASDEVSHDGLAVGNFVLVPDVFSLDHGEEQDITVKYTAESLTNSNEWITFSFNDSQHRSILLSGASELAAVQISGEDVQEIVTSADNCCKHYNVSLPNATRNVSAEMTLNLENVSHMDIGYEWQVELPQHAAVATECKNDTASGNRGKRAEKAPSSRLPLPAWLPREACRFTALPTESVLLSCSVSQFSISHKSHEIGLFTADAHLLAMPLSGTCPSDLLGKDQVAQRQCLAVLHITAQVDVSTVQFYPSVAMFPPVLVGKPASMNIQCVNTSPNKVSLQWMGIEDTDLVDDVSITPSSHASLAPGDSVSCCLTIAAKSSIPLQSNLLCRLLPDGAIVKLPILLSDVKGPEVTMKSTHLDFGVVRQGVNASLMLQVSNISDASAHITLKDVSEHSLLRFLPSPDLKLEPKGSRTVVVHLIGKEVKTVDTVVKCHVRNGATTCLSVTGCVERIQASLESDTLELANDDFFVYTPTSVTTKLCNHSRLPAAFVWQPIFGCSSKHCEVSIKPESGVLESLEEIEMSFTVTTAKSGALEELLVWCEVQGMDNAIIARITGNAQGPEVSCQDSIIHFAEECKLGNSVETTIFLHNPSPVSVLLACSFEEFPAVSSSNEMTTVSTLSLDDGATGRTVNMSGMTTGSADAGRYRRSALRARELTGQLPSEVGLLPKMKFENLPYNQSYALKAREFELSAALKGEHGAAFTCFPAVVDLKAKSTAALRVRAYADMWGVYKDHLLGQAENMKDLRIPIHLVATGSPLAFTTSSLMKENSHHGLINFGALSPYVQGAVERSVEIRNTSSSDIRVDWELRRVRNDFGQRRHTASDMAGFTQGKPEGGEGAGQNVTADGVLAMAQEPSQNQQQQQQQQQQESQGDEWQISTLTEEGSSGTVAWTEVASNEEKGLKRFLDFEVIAGDPFPILEAGTERMQERDYYGCEELVHSSTPVIQYPEECSLLYCQHNYEDMYLSTTDCAAPRLHSAAAASTSTAASDKHQLKCCENSAHPQSVAYIKVRVSYSQGESPAKLFSISPTQMLIPAHGRRTVHVSASPSHLSPADRSSSQALIAEGYLSLDHCHSTKFQQSTIYRPQGYAAEPMKLLLAASIEQERLSIEKLTNTEWIASPAEFITRRGCNNQYDPQWTRHSFILQNTTSAAMKAELTIGPPFQLMTSSSSSSVSPSVGTSAANMMSKGACNSESLRKPTSLEVVFKPRSVVTVSIGFELRYDWLQEFLNDGHSDVGDGHNQQGAVKKKKAAAAASPTSVHTRLNKQVIKYRSRLRIKYEKNKAPSQDFPLTVTVPLAQLHLVTNVISFGTVSMGHTVVKTAHLKNVSLCPASWSLEKTSCCQDCFVVVSPHAGLIQAKHADDLLSSVLISVMFTPKEEKAYKGSIRIQVRLSNNPTVNLSFTGRGVLDQGQADKSEI
ncbi:deleted in lung and esophageal cancer protein 1-like isoform X2 [Sycon ciliatum]|uniref:deleted in lung and esophageal cancer protein 1-like isoform X2 n=1 Tax=Sycon ciliatum TaxID=27933 RepID=UPI0031F6FFB1